MLPILTFLIRFFLPIMVAIDSVHVSPVATVAMPVPGTPATQIESRCLDEGNEGMTWAVLFAFSRNKFKIGFLALMIYAALC